MAEDPVSVIVNSIQFSIQPITEWCDSAAANPHSVMHDCPVGSMESTLEAQQELSSFLSTALATINQTISNESIAFENYESDYQSLFDEYGSMANETCAQYIEDCYAPDVERDSYIICINSTSNDLGEVSNDLADELNSLKDNCKKAKV